MSSAKTRTAFFAAIALLASCTLAQAAATRSGLPWASGVNRPPEQFAAWRGRNLDLKTVFFGKRTWDHMRVSAGAKPMPYQMVVAIGMLPDSHRGQLAQCATGAFDREIAAIRDGMLRNGYRGSLLRLGWEANRVNGFAWAVQGDGRTWVGCWRRWAAIFNPMVDADADPATPPTRRADFKLVWNMANAGTFPYPIEKMYPGNDVVDVVASQWYDRCPPITTDAEWSKRVWLKDKWGNPAGPRSWMAFAQSKGKKWALPEWGIGGDPKVCAKPGIDNPYFITRMHGLLMANAASVAFESYFNSPGGSVGTHEIYPSANNPKAAAVYKQKW